MYLNSTGGEDLGGSEVPSVPDEEVILVLGGPALNVIPSVAPGEEGGIILSLRSTIPFQPGIRVEFESYGLY